MFPQSLSRVLRDVQQELGTDARRERAGDCRGEGTAGLHKRKCHLLEILPTPKRDPDS